MRAEEPRAASAHRMPRPQYLRPAYSLVLAEKQLRTFVGSNCAELIGVIAPLAAAARALHMFRALGPCQSKPQGRRPVAKRMGAAWGANADVQKRFDASTPAP